MLIVALVLAVIGLAALVTAVVTSNELVAWVCIAASVLGVILLIVDAIRERQQREDSEDSEPAAAAAEPATSDAIAYSAEDTSFDADYPEAVAEEQHPDEVVSDEPESDTPATTSRRCRRRPRRTPSTRWRRTPRGGHRGDPRGIHRGIHRGSRGIHRRAESTDEAANADLG